jgi:hypothetical protein
MSSPGAIVLRVTRQSLRWRPTASPERQPCSRCAAARHLPRLSMSTYSVSSVSKVAAGNGFRAGDGDAFFCKRHKEGKPPPPTMLIGLS